MPEHNDRRYSIALLVLTAATGAADGVTFVALNQVFAGNMTGNVLFLGFGLAGAAGISPLNNLTALAAFLLGAISCSAFLRGLHPTTRLHPRSLVVLAVGALLSTALAVVWFISGSPDELGRLGYTAVLAFVLGAQAAAVKPSGIRDLSTVVVTMTMVNLSVDTVAAGKPQRLFHRIAAIGIMAAGGFLAAVLALQAGGAWALLAAILLMLAGLSLLSLAVLSESRDRRSGQERAQTEKG